MRVIHPTHHAPLASLPRNTRRPIAHLYICIFISNVYVCVCILCAPFETIAEPSLAPTCSLLDFLLILYLCFSYDIAYCYYPHTLNRVNLTSYVYIMILIDDNMRGVYRLNMRIIYQSTWSSRGCMIVVIGIRGINIYNIYGVVGYSDYVWRNLQWSVCQFFFLRWISKCG